MKFGYAWTFGETPAPEKRTPALPRPPACLRNSNWAASPRRACFCLLGGFRIRFGHLEHPQDPLQKFKLRHWLISLIERRLIAAATVRKLGCCLLLWIASACSLAITENGERWRHGPRAPFPRRREGELAWERDRVRGGTLCLCRKAFITHLSPEAPRSHPRHEADDFTHSIFCIYALALR